MNLDNITVHDAEQEFDHFIRIVTDDELASGILREYFKLVYKSPVGKLIDQQDDGTVMIYHTRDNDHCYDISLNANISKLDGDILSRKLLTIFPFDFSIEASTANANI